MVPIIMKSESGELISDEEAILPFLTLPKIVIWGYRHFVLTDESMTDRFGRIIPVYVEAFFYHITGLEKNMVQNATRPTP